MPLEWLLRYVDRPRLAQLRSGCPEKIRDLGTSIRKEGIQEPLELILDSHGKLRLQEGHHRMTAITETPHLFRKVPVKFRRSNGKIRAHGRMVTEEMEWLLEFLARDS